MPLARFDKLDKSKKNAILDAAAREFSEHGFGSASYNRIIERAGISKGAMYYYFADKDDLFRTVLAAAQAAWLGHMTLPSIPDSAAAYWRECEAIYQRILGFFFAEPIAAALCFSIAQARQRGESHPALVELGERLEAWTAEIIRLGQRVGAVRTDVPSALLVHVAFSIIEGGDRWLASHWDEMSPDQLKPTAHMLIDLMRRIAEPATPQPLSNGEIP